MYYSRHPTHYISATPLLSATITLVSEHVWESCKFACKKLRISPCNTSLCLIETVMIHFTLMLCNSYQTDQPVSDMLMTEYQTLHQWYSTHVSVGNNSPSFENVCESCKPHELLTCLSIKLLAELIWNSADLYRSIFQLVGELDLCKQLKFNLSFSELSIWNSPVLYQFAKVVFCNFYITSLWTLNVCHWSW